jgi:hypothetical protein
VTNRAVYLAAFALIVVGLSIFVFKVRTLGLPVIPEEEATVWTVEARAAFMAQGEPIEARLTIPRETPGFEVLDEDFISSNYGYSTIEEKRRRRAEWTVRREKGRQVVYYRLTVIEDGSERRHTDPHPGYPRRERQSESVDSAVEALLERVRDESADIESFAVALVRRLNSGEKLTGGAVDLLNERSVSPLARARQISDVLAGARIPSRVVLGVMLREGVRDADLVPFVEVHNDEAWIPIDPITGKRGYPEGFLPWATSAEPLIDLEGATNGQVDFAVTRSVRAMVDIAARRAESRHAFWFETSLLALPVQVQNVYRILLMVPVGAFIVAVLRTFVGVTTFGTFMPVLIALAFRETDLGVGMLLFVLILAIGLGLRFALDRLHLLLVPRLTAVLIIVVMVMLLVSIASFQVGVERGISVALFPMVILAMTIERMSLVWEELGAQAALLQGAGSLFVAAIAYFVVTNRLLSYQLFVFPELLLILLAMALMAGRFTGYRLTEYWRFRSFLTSPADGDAG